VAAEFRHERPDRCVVGTVGEPGQRTFFLQARSGALLTSVVLEKTQVATLADQLEGMLDDIVRRSGGLADVPAVTPEAVEDLGPLELPLEEEFRVGTMGLAWDPDTQRVELAATAVARDGGGGEGQPDAEDDLDVLVVWLTGGQARAFVSRARAVVSAGRPPCPFCAQPLDPSGHICPRQNGFRRRS
jgi:uncharacterized repeat protein (TIGR03847 family)